MGPAKAIAVGVRYVPQLDGLRAVAIGLVFLHHLPRFIGREVGLLQPLASAGWFGVDIFFALSGFLITRILLAGVGRPFGLRTFYVRRALRILPLYYSVLTLIFVMRSLTPSPPAEAMPSPMWFYGFLSNFWYARKSGTSDLALEVTWSLSVEEQFYVLWPLLVSCASRRTLTILLCTAIAAAPFFRLYLAHSGPTLCYTFCRVDALAVGCVAALWWDQRRGPVPAIAGPAAAGLWCLLAALVWLGGFREDAWGIPVFLYVLVPVATATTIVAVLSGRACRLSRVLSWQPMIWMGRISFGLYLLHPLCFNAARHVGLAWGWYGPDGPWHASLLLAALAVSLSLLTAAASYQILEQPFLALKDRLAPGTAAARVAVG